MILEVLTAVEKAYDKLKSKKTQEELHEIFEIGDDFREKVIKMFHIGTDAAEDAVQMFILAAGVFERIVGPPVSRSIPLPIESSIFSYDDLVEQIVEEVQPIRPSMLDAA